jgi:hypothetical protein
MDAAQVGEETGAELRSYRWWQSRFLACPADARIRARFERTVAALCAATGERCGREAASAAERRLRGADHPSSGEDAVGRRRSRPYEAGFRAQDWR